MDEPTKNMIDVSAGGVTIGAVMQWIPEVTAVASLIWVVIRIYETKTIQRCIKRGKK